MEELRWIDRGEGFEDTIASGPHEVELTGVFLEAWAWCKRTGYTFLDVGAHVGRYALRAAQAGVSVVAIEPFPETRRGLLNNLKVNDHLVDRVSVLGHAAWDERTRVRLGVPRPEDGTGLPEHPGHGCVRACPREDDAVEVEAWPLDELLPTMIGPDLRIGAVKIDVEGAEGRVLRGARSILALNGLPRLIIELHHRYYGHEILDDVRGTLDVLGYRWTLLGAIGGSDYLLARAR